MWENCPCPDACQVLREHLRVFWGAQEIVGGLVCVCSRFQTVTREQEKEGNIPKSNITLRKWARTPVRGQGVRKDKLRVYYFDHITQKKMVLDSGQKKTWNCMEMLGPKDSVILKLLSPMTLWCFKKYFRIDTANFLVVSCCLSIRLKLFISFYVTPRGSLLGTLGERILWPVPTRLLAGWGPTVRDGETSEPWIMGSSLLWGEKRFANVTSWDLLGKKRGVFSISFPSSKFSEICLIFARCQTITLLVSRKWLMISLMTMQSLKLTFTL